MSRVKRLIALVYLGKECDPDFLDVAVIVEETLWYRLTEGVLLDVGWDTLFSKRGAGQMVTLLTIVFATLLTVWGISFESQAASAREKVVISYSAMHARTAPLWLAEEQRFFAKYGIDAEVIYVRSTPIVLSGLASGDIDIAFTGAHNVLGGASGGLDLKMLASFTNRMTQDLVARPSIQTVEDLRGKRFGVVSFSGMIWMVTMLGLDYLGLDPKRDNITFLLVADQTVMAQALVAGTIDAVVLDGIHSRWLQEKGMRILAEFRKVNIPLPSIAVMARASVIQTKPLAIENVLKALVEAHVYALDPSHKAMTLNTIQRRLKVNARAAEEGFKDIVAGFERKPPYSSIEGMRNIQRLMKIGNPKLGELNVEELIDDRIVRKLDESGFINRLYDTYGRR